MNRKSMIIRELKSSNSPAVNSKKLSLTKYSQKNIHMKKDENTFLPDIGQRMSSQLPKNQPLFAKNEVQSTLSSRKRASSQEQHQFYSLHSKAKQNSKKNHNLLRKQEGKRIELKSIRNTRIEQSQEKFTSFNATQKQMGQTDFKEESKLMVKRTESFTQKQDKQKKLFVSTGIQTLEITTNKESYDEFLKFSITKKASFEKFKQLITYMETLAGLEQQNFKKNHSDLNSILKDAPIDNRQKRVDELIKDLSASKCAFSSLFKQSFIKERIMFKDLQVCLNDFSTHIQQSLKQAEKKIVSLMLEQEIFQKEINPKNVREIFSEIAHLQKSNIQNKNIFLNQISNDLYINYNNLQEKFSHWHQNSEEQYRLIKSCVSSIIKLPELAINLFGDNRDLDHELTNTQIKKFCFNERNLPHLSDFFVKRGNQNAKQIDEFFSKCCQVKCMNCIYMRSKMRFIYEKNNELKPIIKALMNLIEIKFPDENFEEKFRKASHQQ